MNLPKVTIMIPTYNQESYICEAIESAINQDYLNLEIVVTDDCSPDNTEHLVSPIKDTRLKYHRNSKNLGRVGNYHNTAHNIATGEWAINLDGDDYFTSFTFVSEAMSTIQTMNNENIVAYCFSHPNIDEIKKLMPNKEIDENRILVSGKDYFLNYYKIGNFGHPNTIFNRKLGVTINLYTLPHQACDFHSLIRLFLLGNIILDKRTISHWRIHGQNTTLLEVKDKQSQARLTFDAIEDFAKIYCTKQELKKWRKGMDKSAFDDYLNSYVNVYRNWKALYLLLSHPKLNKRYLKNWLILLSIYPLVIKIKNFHFKNINN